VNAYIDSSVLLRLVFGEPGTLAGWERIERAISSELIRIECLRTLDRARIRAQLDDRLVAERRRAILETIEGLELIGLERPVLERAAEPFPIPVTTLDALHLASALLVRDRYESLVFATHDVHLGLTAEAMGFAVEGVIA
jgi:predicted nucleic acid-binding protein